MHSYRIAAVGALVAAAALGAGGVYNVSDQQLESLHDNAKRMERGLGGLLREFDSREVIPSARDRGRLREMIEALSSDGRSLSQELRRIHGQEGNPTEPQIRRQDLEGFYVVGDKDLPDVGAASSSHRSACDSVEAKLREVFGASFDVFVCGEKRNVTQYPSLSYKRFASVPKVSIRYRGVDPLRAIPAGDVAGQVDSPSAYDAWASWWGSCKTFLDGQRNKYGERFVAAECGKPLNVTAYASLGYQKLLSSGTVYLRD